MTKMPKPEYTKTPKTLKFRENPEINTERIIPKSESAANTVSQWCFDKPVFNSSLWPVRDDEPG